MSNATNNYIRFAIFCGTCMYPVIMLLLKRSRSSGDYEEVLSPLSPIPSMPAYANKNRKSRSLDYGKALLMPSSIPEGWSYEINDEGKAAYIHETTKQKVCQNILWS